MSSKNILLVDDSIVSSMIVSNFLNENGYLTETVASGEDAIKKACSNSHLDLIIMDIELAGNINGIEAASSILNCIDIPIVFLTSHSSKDILNKIKEVQAYGFVLKTMDKYALLSTIEMAFNLYEANARTQKINFELKKAHEKLRTANAELEDSRQHYLELTENAPVGIIKCDANGTIIFINQKALEIIGSPSAEETKKINLLTFTTLVNSGLSEQLIKCLQSNEYGVFETNFESIWGKRVCIRLHIKPLTDRQIVNGAQLILDDISEKKHLEEELRRLSLTDPLTNIYNRRYFIQKLEKEIDHILQKSYDTFCISVLDIDHFKNINDCYGHNTGDLVLKLLTKTIKNRIRKIDCVARWGGEEFIILFPNTQVSQAVLLIEELRKAISKMEFSFEDRVTASFGVVEYCLGDTVDSIIHRADNLMYEAKSAGRNCVKFDSF